MDSIQQILVQSAEEHAECLNERNKLRAILSDCIPENKKQQNLLLNAFDENIQERFATNTDKSFVALNMIRELENNYGITVDAAFWTVETWCLILGHAEIVDAMEVLKPSAEKKVVSSNSQYANDNKSFSLYSTYRAGTDFPAGEILIKLSEYMKEGYVGIDIGSSPKSVKRLTDCKNQAYAKLKDGEFLYVRPYNWDKIKPDNITYTIQAV